MKDDNYSEADVGLSEWHVRFGSFATELIAASQANVRYALNSDHSTAEFVCPLSATSGHGDIFVAVGSSIRSIGSGSIEDAELVQ